MIDADVRFGAGGRPLALAVDGGITPETATDVLAAGADTLIAGTAVFGAADRAGAIAALRRSAAVAALRAEAAHGEAPLGGPPRDASPGRSG